MNWKNRDFGASLVLDFSVFIAGFLTGMLAIAIIGVSSDITTISVIIFALGFAIGIAVTLTLVFWRRKRNPSFPGRILR
jgi:hypothetical protein